MACRQQSGSVSVGQCVGWKRLVREDKKKIGSPLIFIGELRKVGTVLSSEHANDLNFPTVFLFGTFTRVSQRTYVHIQMISGSSDIGF